MSDSIPEAKFGLGVCVFTRDAFQALLVHRVRPNLLVEAHATLMPGAMDAVQLQERLAAVFSCQPIVSRFRLKAKLFGPAAADLVVTTAADRSTTVVRLVEEVEAFR